MIHLVRLEFKRTAVDMDVTCTKAKYVFANLTVELDKFRNVQSSKK